MRAIALDIGNQDLFVTTNRQLNDVAHTFHVYEGDHGNHIRGRFEMHVLPVLIRASSRHPEVAKRRRCHAARLEDRQLWNPPVRHAVGAVNRVRLVGVKIPAINRPSRAALHDEVPGVVISAFVSINYRDAGSRTARKPR